MTPQLFNICLKTFNGKTLNTIILNKTSVPYPVKLYIMEYFHTFIPSGANSPKKITPDKTLDIIDKTPAKDAPKINFDYISVPIIGVNPNTIIEQK